MRFRYDILFGILGCCDLNRKLKKINLSIDFNALKRYNKRISKIRGVIIMKKILAIVLAVVMLFSIAACNSSTNDVTDNGEKVYNIGICQLVQHPALDEATKGFRDALTEKLGDKVKFDEQNASGEATNCTTITSKFVSDKVDLIMANATDALTAASQATDTIPIVATSITDYATALGITDWNGKTGFNVTGTSDLAPLAEQAKMIKELVPTAKNVGILYCSA